MNIVHFPDALPRFIAARAAGIVVRGSWGEGPDVSVCMMSAAFPGVTSDRDCALQGCPEWLSTVTRYLFDQDVGAKNEDKAAFDWAEAAFGAMATPFDADAALDRFLIRRLADGDHSALALMRVKPVDANWWRACEVAVINVADLLRRRLAGEDVRAELKAAAHAALAAAHAANLSYATLAAANATISAALAGLVAYDANSATNAALAALAVRSHLSRRCDARAASGHAIHSATREDLIAAIIESQIGEPA